MPSNAEQLVDFSQIDALLKAAGRDGVQDILNAFWRSTDQLAERLALQIEAGELNDAARSAHAIKGSAANVGASSLAMSARSVETYCRENNARDAKDALSIMTVAYANTRAMISARLEAA